MQMACQLLLAGMKARVVQLYGVPNVAEGAILGPPGGGGGGVRGARLPE